jgi:hypothetical protein
VFKVLQTIRHGVGRPSLRRIRFENRFPVPDFAFPPGLVERHSEIIVVGFRDGILLTVGGWQVSFEGDRARDLRRSLAELWEVAWQTDVRDWKEARIVRYSWCDQDGGADARGDLAISLKAEARCAILSLRPNGWESFGPKAVGLDKDALKTLVRTLEEAMPDK